jgi:hypothetical protein
MGHRFVFYQNFSVKQNTDPKPFDPHASTTDVHSCNEGMDETVKHLYHLKMTPVIGSLSAQL